MSSCLPTTDEYKYLMCLRKGSEKSTICKIIGNLNILEVCLKKGIIEQSLLCNSDHRVLQFNALRIIIEGHQE